MVVVVVGLGVGRGDDDTETGACCCDGCVTVVVGGTLEDDDANKKGIANLCSPKYMMRYCVHASIGSKVLQFFEFRLSLSLSL